jgi:hypothetical protein
VFGLNGYGARSGSSYGGLTRSRHFGSSAKHRRNWDKFPLTGSAEGDLHARLAIQHEAEDRLFLKR